MMLSRRSGEERLKILILSTYEGMDANAVRDYLLSFRLHSRSASSKRRAPRFADPSGRFAAMKSRTSCRNAASSGVSRSSM